MLENCCVVNVATDEHYEKGQERLCAAFGGACDVVAFCRPPISLCPTHREHQYAFKAYILEHVRKRYPHQFLIWCDCSIVPGAASIERVIEKAMKHGVWLPKNGNFTNYEWTADNAYVPLFHSAHAAGEQLENGLNLLRAMNRTIPHCATGAFCIDLGQIKGREFLHEFYTLASETRAFNGPWTNANFAGEAMRYPGNPFRERPCGPADVRGHRHDQTAASVIAWRLGIPLSADHFAYRGGETAATVFIADGAY